VASISLLLPPVEGILFCAEASTMINVCHYKPIGDTLGEPIAALFPGLRTVCSSKTKLWKSYD
jgi:hypothetical protein